MPEWWTYGLSDFMLFSPRTYYRLIERYNAAVWPGHLAALALAGAIAWRLARPGPRQARVILGILAPLWGWIAWAFLWNRYATINWAATWFAGAFALEALLLAVLGGTPRAPGFRVRRGGAAVAGTALFVAALALYPVIAPLLGRGWGQAEVFGVMPDPTAIGTIGLLLLTEGAPRRWGLPVPVLWCLISGATLWGMRS